jgi:F420-dependent oxidoreductase-like protein
MVAISLQIEGQTGLTWTRWKRLVAAADQLGFAGLYRSDHFTAGKPPDQPSLETMMSLAYAADHTQRIHFGPLVAPFSFRHPVHLARQAIALDDLSGGRMILGLGAGWQAREHTMFGFDLLDVPPRMARFEEGLQVVTQLLRSEQPVTFEGRYYQLRDAHLLPRPERPGGPRILIGGDGPKRTLPLVARYADIWNAPFLTPDQFRERSALLDEQVRQAGRTSAIKRTLMTSLYFARTTDVLERQLSQSGTTLQSQLDAGDVVVGTPRMVVEQIGRYGQAGVEELVLQWRDLDDLDGLQAFAESVLPHV